MPLIRIILALVFMLIMTHCSQKEQGITDYAWQEESLKMAGEICKKISDCVNHNGTFHELDKSKSELIESRLQEVKCQDYHRKTNVFLLIGKNPEAIKTATRNCHSAMTTMSCDDLIDKNYKNISSCEEMGRIQKGL